MTQLVWTRADLFWYCRGTVLNNTLLPDWTGMCTPTRLIVPVHIFGRQLHKQIMMQQKRHTAQFDWMTNSPTYINAIGVPRGVPNDHKLVNQVAGGFESSC